MYAVIQIGSRQFKVSEGDHISVNRLKNEKDKNITLNEVLMFAKGSDVRIGQPFLKDVKVTAKVVNHFSGEKLIAFKYRRKKSSAMKKGYRQRLSTLNITKISAQ